MSHILPMTIFADDMTVSFPLWQLMLFMLAVSVAVMCSRFRLIALICYIFLINWIMSQQTTLYALDNVTLAVFCLVCLFGVTGVVITFYSLLHNND